MHSPTATVQLRRLADAARQATLHVVWRQWRALGAVANTPGTARPMRSQVDPEALLLVSFTLMNGERRLADLLHDWAAMNASLLSVQRTRNLATEYADAGDRSIAIHLAWFAAIARDSGKDLRWRPVADTWPEVHAAVAEASTLVAKDSGRAVSARPTALSDAALLLRLRLGLGVGVKSDIIAYLLGNGGAWATIRDIVRATSYTPAAVRRSAVDLVTAGFLEEEEGSPAAYRANPLRWASLLDLGEEVPAWADWRSKFLFVDALSRWAIAAAERPLTSDAFGVQARELMERHRGAFEQDQISRWSDRTPINDWGEYATGAIESLSRWMVESA